MVEDESEDKTAMSDRRVGVEISDRALYDRKHDESADKRHLDHMERDALYLLEGIRRHDQEDPAIARELDTRA